MRQQVLGLGDADRRPQAGGLREHAGDHQAALVREDDQLGAVTGVQLRHRLTWVLVVAGLRNRRAAISSFDRPSATRPRISRSRSVSRDS